MSCGVIRLKKMVDAPISMTHHIFHWLDAVQAFPFFLHETMSM